MMTAQRIADDGYFAYSSEPPGSEIPPNAVVTPGWPLALSGHFLIGSDTDDPVARAVQARSTIGMMMLVFSFGIVCAVTLTGYSLGGRSLGLLAGIMAAFYLPFSWAGSVMLAEHMGALVLACAVWLAVRLTDHGSNRPYIEVVGLGVALGILLMVRPNLALWVFVPLAYVVVMRLEPPARVVRLAALGVVGFLLVMAPWWIRNMVVMDRWIPVKSDHSIQVKAEVAESEGVANVVPVSTSSSSPGGWEYTSPRMVVLRASVPWIPHYDVAWEDTHSYQEQRIDYNQQPGTPHGLTGALAFLSTAYHRILWLLALVSIIFVKRVPRIALLAGVPVAVLAVHWSHITIRYLYPPMPAIVVLAAVAIHTMYFSTFKPSGEMAARRR